MKSTLAFLLAAVILSASLGCANGPIRNFLGRKQCDPCSAPAADPTFGYGYNETAWPADAPGYVESVNGDPYVHGSNYGGATINQPAFNEYSIPGDASTFVPSDSSGALPSPGPGG